MLQEGDAIPNGIILQDQNGHPHKLEDYIGKFIVLYFYPKDETPGCTAEACDFRDYNNDIRNLNAEILGVSKDSIKSHKKFEDKKALNFTLLSDEELILQKAFGVWDQKSLFGKVFMGTKRTTFLVNPEGIITKVWKDVNPNNHAAEVYKVLKSINGTN